MLKNTENFIWVKNCFIKAAYTIPQIVVKYFRKSDKSLTDIKSNPLDPTLNEISMNACMFMLATLLYERS